MSVLNNHKGECALLLKSQEVVCLFNQWVMGGEMTGYNSALSSTLCKLYKN